MAQRCNFGYLNLQTSQREQSGPDVLPDIQKFTEIFQRIKVEILFQLENFLCPVKFTTVFSFAAVI